jgi:hypothetical protein
MEPGTHISAITVNHNTSHFVELLVRTLFLTNDPDTLDCALSVLDNASDDAQLPALTSYLATYNIALQQTGFDTGIAVEKHGAALRAFVLNHPHYTHYLFLDSDIWFVEPDTIGTMLRELDAADPAVFANQARIMGYYAGRVIEGRDGTPGAGDPPTWPAAWLGREYTISVYPRCSPVCCLIKNTPLFRRVVEMIGLTPALQFQPDRATYYDTLGLLTQVMATHGQRFIVSSKTVNHFTETVHRPELRAPKDHDCLRMLDELRAGRGMALEIFYESEWVKQHD